jgi:tRNA G18 (ribose-2'-O)-methylase SpoU
MDRQLTHHEIQWTEKTFPLIVACDDWRDPRNVGMAFRLADALGVAELWLGGHSPAPPNRKLSRSARQTEKWVPYRRVPDLAAGLAAARKDGYHLIGLEITADSQSIYAVKVRELEKVILVVGAESEGIAPAIIGQLHGCVHLPMYGRNTSLNVATALGIALGELTRQWNHE